MLAGIYRFKVVSAKDYTPISSVVGDYSITSKETGEWNSDRNGDVYLDHLKVGLTNIVMKNDPDYFNIFVNGAKVLKGEESREAKAVGRSLLLVPRNLDKELMLTLTWVGKEYQLNLMAETFIDSDKGIYEGENCVLSFGQPKCKGMEHLTSRERSVLGETIKVNSNLFYDKDQNLVKDKRIMIYVMDTTEKKDKDISGSNAIIGLSMPENGQVAQVSVPFMTKEEAAIEDISGVQPFNWAALCLWVEPNAQGYDEMRFQRLNGLSIFKPNAVELCGTPKSNNKV